MGWPHQRQAVVGHAAGPGPTIHPLIGKLGLERLGRGGLQMMQPFPVRGMLLSGIARVLPCIYRFGASMNSSKKPYTSNPVKGFDFDSRS